MKLKWNNNNSLEISTEDYELTIDLKDKSYMTFRSNINDNVMKLPIMWSIGILKACIDKINTDPNIKLFLEEVDETWELSIVGNGIELCINLNTLEYSTFKNGECSSYPKRIIDSGDHMVINNTLYMIKK